MSRTIIRYRTPRGKRHRRWLVVSNHLTRVIVEHALRDHSNVESYRGITHDRDNLTHVHVGLELVETRTASAVEAMFPVPVKVIPYVGLRGDPHHWGRTYRYYMHDTPDSRHKAKYHLEEIWTSPGVDVAAALAALAVREERDATTRAQVFRRVADGELTPDDLYALGGVHRRIWQDNLAALTRLAENVSAVTGRLSDKAHAAAEETTRREAEAARAEQTRKAEKAARRAAKKAAAKAEQEAAALAERIARERAEREAFERSPEGIELARQKAEDHEREVLSRMLRFVHGVPTETGLMGSALEALEVNDETDAHDVLGFTAAELAATLVEGQISHMGLMMLAAYGDEAHYAAEDEDLVANIRESLRDFKRDEKDVGQKVAALELHAVDGDNAALEKAVALRRQWSCVREFAAPRPDLPKDARQRLLDASNPTNPNSR